MRNFIASVLHDTMVAFDRLHAHLYEAPWCDQSSKC